MGVPPGGGYGGEGGLLFFCGSFWWIVVLNRPHKTEIGNVTFPKMYTGQKNPCYMSIFKTVKLQTVARLV